MESAFSSFLVTSQLSLCASWTPSLIQASGILKGFVMFKKIIIIDMTIIIMEEFLDPHVSNKLLLSKSI